MEETIIVKRYRLDKLFLLIVLLSLPTLACSVLGNSDEPAAPTVTPPPQVDAPTQTPVIIIATPTPAEEQPPAPDAPEMSPPTAEPGQPTMITLVDLNVRRGPGTNYGVVGALRGGSSALIVGRSPDGGWWKIACPPGTGAECWSSALPQYSSSKNAENVPVAAVPPPPAPIHTATATATSTTTATATSTTTATPTTDGTTTTTATPTVTPTQDVNATATTTPTPTPTDTALIAPFDNDSLQNPAVSHFMSPTGTRNFTFNEQVSYAEGDQEDWVEFEFPNNDNSSQTTWVTLDCTLTGVPGPQLRATVYENGNSTNKIILCGQGETQITVDNTKVQQLRIHFGITGDPIYASYALTVVGYR